MEKAVNRHRNLILLVAILFAQVIGLAVQVKRPTDQGSTLLIRVWAVRLFTPLQEAVVHSGHWTTGLWRNYLDLRNVRTENADLRQQIRQLRLDQVRLGEDASQARRLQALFEFKEQYISSTLPAQVISTSGSEFSRSIYIDKGARSGLKVDMPVISPSGIVGKIYRVYPSSSLVLLINDPSSGAGVILKGSRLQGILRGTPGGETRVEDIMSDEKVEPGETVLTSGGDRIFPKGLPVGVVTHVVPGNDLFLNIRVKPSASLERLEEVLVITKIEDKAPSGDDLAPVKRAADMLAERLPSVPTSDAQGKPLPTSGLPAVSTGMPAPTRNLPPPAAASPLTAEGQPAPPKKAMARNESAAKGAAPIVPPNTGAKPAGASTASVPSTSPKTALPGSNHALTLPNSDAGVTTAPGSVGAPVGGGSKAADGTR